MEIKSLGRSGLKVSNLCLGTMAFGRWIDQQRSAEVLDTALDGGINFIDTANFYGKGQDTGSWQEIGESESILGRLLESRRQRVVLATKVFHAVGPGPNDRGLSRKHIMTAVEESLRRLKTDYIDLYQCHRPDDSTPLEETMRALDDLVRQGKVRYTGCSNFFAWQIAKANGIALLDGLTPFVSVQPQYSLLFRSVEQELIPFCKSEGVGMMVYSPIARGLLAGKYKAGEAPPEGTRAAAGEPLLYRLMTERNFALVEQFRALCAEWGLPMAQVATAWVMANSAVTSTIIGASRPGHVTDAIAAAGLKLSPEQIERLNQMFAV